MFTTEVSFFSDVDRVCGYLRIPTERPDEPLPCIVQGPGFMSLKDTDLYERYHARFAEAGYASLVFDYRGFGDSNGRTLIDPDRQVEDIRNAVTFVETRDELDSDRIGLLGVGGTGGGNAIEAAGRDSRIRCVVVNAAIGDGAEWLRSMRREYEWQDLRRRLAAARRQRVQTGEEELVSPFGEIMIPTPERQRRSSSGGDNRKPDQIPLGCVDSIIEAKPVELVDRISPRGSMFICVEGDDVTPMEQSIDLFENAAPPKKLVVQSNTTHYKAYDTYFEEVSSQMIDWYDRHLRVGGLKTEQSGNDTVEVEYLS